MLKTTLFLCTVFLSSIAIAQRANTYFFTNNGTRVSTRDSADFIRIVSEPDTGSALYNVTEFYKSGKKKRVGKSSSIDPLSFEGACISFYENGHKESIKNYEHGFQTDAEYDYYPSGKPSETKQFAPFGDMQRLKGLTYNFLIMEKYDTLGTALVTDGNGHYKGGEYQKSVDDKFVFIEEEGDVKNGRMNGRWKGNVTNPRGSFIEYYDNGILNSGIFKDSSGASETYAKMREAPAVYKGDITEFYRYLGKTIRYPAIDRENNTQGRVVLQFNVEADGSITDIKVIGSVSKTIDAESIRVITNSSPWEPATRFGRSLKTKVTVPLAFKLAN